MKKFLFFSLLLITIFLSPYFIPLKLKKWLIQTKFKNIPGNIFIENITIDPFEGIVLDEFIWENKNTKVLIPSLKLNSSLFSLLIPKKTMLIFENGKVFYKEKILISKLKTFAPIEFNDEQILLKHLCLIDGKIHKEGTEKFINHTLIPSFSSEFFSLQLEEGLVKKTGISSLNTKGKLNLNTLCSEKNILLTLILNLLKQPVCINTKIDCGTICFKIINGITVFDPTPFVIDDTYDILSKGMINFVSGNLNISVAFTTSSLIKAFDIDCLPEGFLIPFTIGGTIAKPKIEIKDAAKAIAALLVLKKIDPEIRIYPKVKPF
jgi:hypothetical protein